MHIAGQSCSGCDKVHAAQVMLKGKIKCQCSKSAGCAGSMGRDKDRRVVPRAELEIVSFHWLPKIVPLYICPGY